MSAKLSMHQADDQGVEPQIFPTGIEILYPGEAGSTTIDIVFVHGLSADRISTWTAQGETSPWPQSLLPYELPQARIMTFGYDSDPLRDSFNDHSEKLLAALAKYRENEADNRPIVFLAHSLGGIVCQNALLKSWNSADEHLRKIGSSTKGVLLFGTPQFGSDSSSLAGSLAKALDTFKSTTHETIQNFLERDSEVLVRIQSDFQIALRKNVKDGRSTTEVACFYEELPTSGIGTVIGKKLSTIPEYRSIGIHGTHSTIVKFKSGDDTGFVRIVETLKAIINQSTTSIGKIATTTSKATYSDETETACLNSLMFSGIDDRHFTIAVEHEETCHWILETPEFKDWLYKGNLDDHNPILWIKGDPGIGKSTLMKYILRHCKSEAGQFQKVASHFFNARGTALENSFVGFMRSILYQLLGQSRPLFDQFMLFFLNRRENHGNSKWQWDLGELKDFFINMIDTAYLPPSIFLIDAVNELGGPEARELVEFFEFSSHLALKVDIPFRVCFSSRHYLIVAINNGREIDIGRRREPDKDIFNYIKDHLKITRGEFRAEIFRRACGNFLWAVLIVQKANREWDHGYSLKDIRRTLNVVPADLNDLFVQLLHQDGKIDKTTALILLWVSLAKKPLSPQQLYFAVLSGVEPEKLKPWDQSNKSQETIERWIVTESKGLVEFRSENHAKQKSGDRCYACFVHESVNVFLIRDWRLLLLDPDLDTNSLFPTQEKLRACCMSYMMMPDLESYSKGRSDGEFISKFPFLGYAVKYMLHHADAALDYSRGETWPQTTLAALQALMDPDKLVRFNALWALVYKQSSPKDIDNAGLLYFASHEGLASLTQCLLEDGADVNSQGGYYGDALQATSANGHDITVQLLLERGADLNLQGGYYGSALQAASANGHISIVKLLFEKGADINFQGGYYGSALQAAAAHVHARSRPIVELLLDAGADVNAQGGYYGNALQAASSRRDAEMINILLKVGAYSTTSVDKIRHSIDSRSSAGAENALNPIALDPTVDREYSSAKSESLKQGSNTDTDYDSFVWSEDSRSSTTSIGINQEELEIAIEFAVSILLQDDNISQLLDQACQQKARVVESSGVYLLRWFGRRLRSTTNNNNPVEIQVAEFFCKRRFDSQIMQRIVRAYNQHEDNGTPWDDLKSQPESKTLMVNKYLESIDFQHQDDHNTRREELAADSQNNISSDDDDTPDDRLLSVNRKSLEGVKQFIVRSQAFVRFKEDLLDFISPFESSEVWDKDRVFWEGSQKVKFERPVDTRQVSLVDRFKLLIQKRAGKPVRWWPFSQPREVLSENMIRIIWPCSCGRDVYADVQKLKAQSYRRRINTFPPTHRKKQTDPILPSSNKSDATTKDGYLALIWHSSQNCIDRFALRFRTTAKKQPPRSSTSNLARSRSSSPPSNQACVHWCVDPSPHQTMLHNIRVKEKSGQEFIRELRKGYRKLRGWRWWFSVLSCGKIHFTKVKPGHRNEIVACDRSGEQLPRKEDSHYKFDRLTPDLDDNFHISHVEGALYDYFHGHKCPEAQENLETIIFGIPRRVSRSQLKFEVGYGIHAEQEYNVWKAFVLIALTQAGPLVFAVIWLIWHDRHDLQNAFVPAMYMLQLVGLLVMIPDIYFS